MAIEFTRVSPVLSVSDIPKAIALYRRLGFEVKEYAEPIYAFAKWGPIELHLSLVHDLDPKTSNACCYVYVNDANALHAQWRDAKVDGRLTDPVDTPYGLREFGYVDPDGNLLRVGSPLT